MTGGPAKPPPTSTAPGVPAPGSHLLAAPLWRREPYRVFFPLGLILAWAGILHWFLHGLGVLPDYRPVFHAITQIQGFMMCFAVGFLFTAIPRRTGTAPPSTWQMLVGGFAPVGTTVAAWFQRFAASQAFWMVLVVALITFAVARFRSAGAARRPPNGFVWVPLSLFMGIVGAILIGAYGFLGASYYRLHDLGRLLLLQGMFLGLVVGVGGFVLPLVTRGEAPPDGAMAGADRLARAGHVAAALLLAGTFWVENSYSLRGGLAARGALLLALLLTTARISHRPILPGWHRWLIWGAAWMIPLGYFMAAALPEQKKAGLHVVFIGGFALMALAVGIHVTLAHGGYERLVRGRPWQVPVIGVLLVLAAIARALVDFDPARFFPWLATAAALFLLASSVWAAFVLPRLRSSPAPDD